MRLAICGLSVSSSWGNGHAVLWRGLINALLCQGHRVVFFERNRDFYAEHRDLDTLPSGGDLVLYDHWGDVHARVRAAFRNADVAMVTSYCPDALPATDLLQDVEVPLRCFYDLDTPVTLARRAAGEAVDYIGREGLAPFDLVLSYTGGRALSALRDDLGAKAAVPLYGSVDPVLHHPVTASAEPRALLSYLGTYAADRQQALERLLIAPARQRPRERFVIGGAQYPAQFPWTPNIWFVRHIEAHRHAAFYCASRMTLNITRSAMAAFGFCPSGRLFEAAACGVPILSDDWEGLSEFFSPGEEIMIVNDTADALAALDMPDLTLAAIGRRARERVLSEHSADRRAREMIAAFESARVAA